MYYLSCKRHFMIHFSIFYRTDRGIISTLPGNSSLLMDGYTCTGSESQLVDCSQLDLSSGCSGSDALTIQCSNKGKCMLLLSF